MRKTTKTADPFVGITTIFLFLLVTCFLFYCGFEGYQGILDAKFKAFCVICGGYILVMGLVAVESALVGELKILTPRTFLQRASWSQKTSLIYLGITWLSAIFSPYFPKTLVGVSRYEGALTITIYVICFLLISVYGRASKQLLCVVGASAAAFGLLCIVQIAGYNPFTLYPAGYSYADANQRYAGAYLGTLGNVDLVAAFLCMEIPIFWIALLRLTGKRRILLLVPLLISLIVLMKMWVLAGVVGVVVGGVAAFLVVAPVSPRMRKCFVFAILVLIVVSFGVIYAFDLGSGLLHELHLILHGQWNDEFGSGRILIWKQVLSKIPAHLLFGTGPDTMLFAELEPFTRYHAGSRGMIVSEIDVAHNEYLNVLYHQGLLGLVAYLVFLLSLMKRWITKANRPAVAVLGGAAFCYCVQAFFGFSMCITAPFFWVILGLLESCGRKNIETSTGGTKSGGKSS